MKISTASATTVVAATLAAAPAAAAIKVATYTGTVISGYDTTGEFGAANTDLTGDTFVATYVYDTSLGQRTVTAGSDGIEGGQFFDTLVGSVVTSTTSPIVGATIKIGSVARSIQAGYDGAALVEQANPQSAEQAYDERSVGAFTISNVLEDHGVYAAVPTSLDTSFTAVPLDSNPAHYPFGTGDFQLSTTDVTTGTAVHDAYGVFGPATLVVSSGPPAPVPEPATWALMVGGFGFVGSAMRGRHPRSPARGHGCPRRGGRIGPVMRILQGLHFAVAAVTMFAGTAHAVPVFVNPDFTSTATTTSFAYNVPITGWNNVSGLGSAAGISAAVPADLWDNGVAPDGETNVTFLQNRTAALQQTVAGFVIGHRYQIKVIADARAATGPTGLSLGVDGAEVGAEVLTPGPVAPVDSYGVYATPWATYTSQVFTARSAASLIQIQNQGIPTSMNYDDVTIDLGKATIVDVTPVPEPAAWTLLITGFGGVGAAMRVGGRTPPLAMVRTPLSLSVQRQSSIRPSL